MANRETNSSPEIRCVFVETNLDTRLILHVHKDEIISDFKDRLLKEHKQVFPEIGEIQISALKVIGFCCFVHTFLLLGTSIIDDWFNFVSRLKDEESFIISQILCMCVRLLMALVETGLCILMPLELTRVRCML
jgi:hypothetical protein